ncbi:hypothetical protein SISSUDRAFT_1034280 [Sistotremastrum suecicum HHB10207 ss-3]|uniref:Uncharacterized protein n=1 Tax=Sistotremastrum suecicum HHB10207 ss-3 TaxID=1314776 RepID=A0A166C9Z5_9AGAM|nr:hypothetical protein SISSUDRAFT_1034280 [Sistotremastrum suecicum HHB10207 ss-3]
MSGSDYDFGTSDNDSVASQSDGELKAIKTTLKKAPGKTYFAKGWQFPSVEKLLKKSTQTDPGSRRPTPHLSPPRLQEQEVEESERENGKKPQGGCREESPPAQSENIEKDFEELKAAWDAKRSRPKVTSESDPPGKPRNPRKRNIVFERLEEEEEEEPEQDFPPRKKKKTDKNKGKARATERPPVSPERRSQSRQVEELPGDEDVNMGGGFDWDFFRDPSPFADDIREPPAVGPSNAVITESTTSAPKKRTLPWSSGAPSSQKKTAFVAVAAGTAQKQSKASTQATDTQARAGPSNLAARQASHPSPPPQLVYPERPADPQHSPQYRSPGRMAKKKPSTGGPPRSAQPPSNPPARETNASQPPPAKVSERTNEAGDAEALFLPDPSEGPDRRSETAEGLSTEEAASVENLIDVVREEDEEILLDEDEEDDEEEEEEDEEEEEEEPQSIEVDDDDDDLIGALHLDHRAPKASQIQQTQHPSQSHSIFVDEDDEDLTSALRDLPLPSAIKRPSSSKIPTGMLPSPKAIAESSPFRRVTSSSRSNHLGHGAGKKRSISNALVFSPLQRKPLQTISPLQRQRQQIQRTPLRTQTQAQQQEASSRARQAQQRSVAQTLQFQPLPRNALHSIPPIMAASDDEEEEEEEEEDQLADETVGGYQPSPPAKASISLSRSVQPVTTFIPETSYDQM